jgi:hypothetical protein
VLIFGLSVLVVLALMLKGGMKTVLVASKAMSGRDARKVMKEKERTRMRWRWERGKIVLGCSCLLRTFRWSVSAETATVAMGMGMEEAGQGRIRSTLSFRLPRGRE